MIRFSSARSRGCELLVLHQVQQKRMRRSREHAIEKIRDQPADDLLPWPGGGKHVRPLILPAQQVSLGGEDVHERQDGGVGDLALTAQSGVDVAHGHMAVLPHHVHDGQLARRQFLFRRHTY